MGLIQQAIRALVIEQKELGIITQKELADKLRTSPSVISALLKGDRRFHEDQIIQICDALKVTLSDLDWQKIKETQPKEILELHRKFQEILDAGNHWTIGITMNIEAIYKDLISTKRRESEKRSLPLKKEKKLSAG
jgi:transcriptional regulator with XRE-family HTH domain